MNNVSTGEAVFAVSMMHIATFQRSFYDVFKEDGGIYSVQYNITRSGSYSLSITHNQDHISGSPFAVIIAPEQVAIEKAQIRAPSSTVFTAGVAGSFCVDTIDRFGNPLTQSQTFAIQMQAPPEAVGTPGAAADGRTSTAIEGIAMLKAGCQASKFGKQGAPHSTTFTLSPDERTLSWQGSGLGKFLPKGEARSVQLSESVQLCSFPSESAARQAALEGCVPCRSPSPSARREQAEAEEAELRVTRAAQERKGGQLSEGKLSDQLEAALASALSELKEARAELRRQRELSEEARSAAEGARQESLRLQRRSSGAEAEAEELREQLRAAQAEGQSLRRRCAAAEEELTARGSADRIATRTQQARRRARTPHCMPPHTRGVRTARACTLKPHHHSSQPPPLTTAAGARHLPSPLPRH